MSPFFTWARLRAESSTRNVISESSSRRSVTTRVAWSIDVTTADTLTMFWRSVYPGAICSDEATLGAGTGVSVAHATTASATNPAPTRETRVYRFM